MFLKKHIDPLPVLILIECIHTVLYTGKLPGHDGLLRCQLTDTYSLEQSILAMARKRSGLENLWDSVVPWTLSS